MVLHSCAAPRWGSDRASVVVCGVARRDRHRRRRLRPSRRVRRRRRHSHRRRGADVGARGTLLGRRTRGSPAGDDRSHRLAAQRRSRARPGLSDVRSGGRGEWAAPALSSRIADQLARADWSPISRRPSPIRRRPSPICRRASPSRRAPRRSAWGHLAERGVEEFADLGPIGILVEDQPDPAVGPHVGGQEEPLVGQEGPRSAGSATTSRTGRSAARSTPLAGFSPRRRTCRTSWGSGTWGARVRPARWRSNARRSRGPGSARIVVGEHYRVGHALHSALLAGQTLDYASCRG